MNADDTTVSALNCHALQVVPLDGARCDAGAPAMLFSAITPSLLRTAAPRLVLSWLYARDHDAVDIARLLGEAGFTGVYRVSCRALPRPGIVKRELMALCPGMTLELDQIPTDDALHEYDNVIANPGAEAQSAPQDIAFLRLLA